MKKLFIFLFVCLFLLVGCNGGKYDATFHKAFDKANSINSTCWVTMQMIRLDSPNPETLFEIGDDENRIKENLDSLKILTDELKVLNKDEPSLKDMEYLCEKCALLYTQYKNKDILGLDTLSDTVDRKIKAMRKKYDIPYPQKADAE